MTKREPLKNQAYFDNVYRYYEEKVAEYKKDFETKPDSIKRWDMMHLLQYEHYFYLLRASYSIGKPISELIPVFESMIDHWYAYYTFAGVEPQIKIRIDSYIETLQFCSLAVLLRTKGETLDKLKTVLALLDIDALLLRFTAYLKIDALKGNKLFFKKPFQPLLDVFDQASANEKTAALKTYLSEWMTLMKPAVYIGTHKIKVNETAFAGYWSFEAAAICIMEGLDARQFQDAPFFPVDLVNYYFEKE